MIETGGLRVSSRNVVTPLAIAAAATVGAFLLLPAGARRRALQSDWRALASLTPAWLMPGCRSAIAAGDRLLAALPGTPSRSAVLAAALAAVIVALGLGRGAHVAGGSDAYGYASYARLWAAGALEVDRPLMAELDDAAFAAAVPAAALAPLGYVARPDRTLAPTYSPGLPMLMGAFGRLGGERAMFAVVPLLAGLAVWATYLLGRAAGGRRVGLASAALLAASPVFLYQLTSAPFSDLPATAWWALALALLPFRSRRAALGAGLAAGAAILTRPNLVPLAIVPGAVLLWLAARERRISGPAVHRLLLFGAGVVPACLVLAWLNAYWFGSPLLSGYGPLAYYFRLEHLAPNLVRYPRWLLETQTPIVLLAAAAPFLGGAGRRGDGSARWLAPACAAFTVAVFTCYAFYLPFDVWWTLRFVLPAFPPMLVLTACAIAAIAARAPFRVGGLVQAAVVATVVLFGVTTARGYGAFDPGSERRYATVGRTIASRLPEGAVLFAMQHSGSLRYYSGRATIRWDFIDPGQLDAAIEALGRLGYRPYILVEDWEEALFRERHAGASRAGALDWPPLLAMEPAGVRVYEPRVLLQSPFP